MLGNGRYSVNYTTVVPSDLYCYCGKSYTHTYIYMFMGIYIYSWEIMHFHGNNIYICIFMGNHMYVHENIFM